MNRNRLAVFLLAALLLAANRAGAAPADAADAAEGRIHSVTDISHEFTFYFDGRFAKNYLAGGGNVDVRNWGTLHKFDFANVNLLVLNSGASPCAYLPEDIQAVRKFLESGGGVIVLGDHTRFREERTYRLNELVKAFGASFVAQRARPPLVGLGKLKGRAVTTYGGTTLALARDAGWQILLRDSAGAVVTARRPVGKGKLLVSSRALVGRQPDAKDPINAEWWQPLLRDLAAGKRVDRKNRPSSQQAENVVDRAGLKVRYSDYMQPFADEIVAVYRQCRPAMESMLGVPPSGEALTSLILLPTGAGGFSSGRTIGLGSWWGGFPKRRYGMIELLGHEATHSWVLPFSEPMWNEGIATYVGIHLGAKLGYRQEADKTLRDWLAQARRHDPKMTRWD
ncbi:MAG: DUF4350 domain-containing protein, partial [Phycisphaerae bacterium]